MNKKQELANAIVERFFASEQIKDIYNRYLTDAMIYGDIQLRCETKEDEILISWDRPATCLGPFLLREFTVRV